MTMNATRFVTPLTFQALSGERVVWDMWADASIPMDHITWGQEADLIIVAPATANFVGKMANGIGDDFLSTMIMAATAKILVCPSMNDRMFAAKALQHNLQTLQERGFSVMQPESGPLACRSEGAGRLPEPADILEEAWTVLSPKDLSNLRILVSAGTTVEPIDPVRYITNRSTGKMGYALAAAARRRGAKVLLVSGPSHEETPWGVNVISAGSAREMRDAVLSQWRSCDVFIKAAAVSDYRPKTVAAQKIKKGDSPLPLELVRNPDILAELGSKKHEKPSLLIGFAAETEDLLLNAEKKLRMKNLDMIVANDVTRDDAGFASDTNLVKLIHDDGRVEDLPMLTKIEVADQVLDRVGALWEKRFGN
jgi:phosphopantothenoylcysteine decarboxylase/phosphopantothenate--cysteine ligase